MSDADGATWEETGLITNGGFEIPNYDEGWADYSSEWTISISGDDASGYGYETKTDGYATNNTSRIFNYYNNSTVQAASFSMTRTLENVPAGTYKLRFEQEGAAGSSGLSVSVGGIQMTLPATAGWDEWATVETASFTLAQEEDVTISIEGEIAPGYWGDFDNFFLMRKVESKPLTAAMIGEISDVYTYDGSAHTPTPEVCDTDSDGQKVTLTACGRDHIHNGTDCENDFYYTYKNNTDAGTATVTVHAVPGGAYSGSAEKTFTIARAAIRGELKISGTPGYGQELTADYTPGSGERVTYQWYRGSMDTPVSGAVNRTYTLTRDDIGQEIFVVVTADDGNHTGTVTSAPVTVAGNTGEGSSTNTGDGPAASGAGQTTQGEGGPAAAPSPQTGDTAGMFLYLAILAIVSGTALVILGRKISGRENP